MEKHGKIAYTVEERKRVAATTAHLVREVGDLGARGRRVISRPWCSRAKARLARGEARLKAYEDGRRQKLQEQAGIKVEMNGEAPTGFMTAKVKARKPRTRLVEVNYKGTRHEGAKEALKAALSFYVELFAARGGPANSQLDWVLDRRLPPEDAAELCAPWEEAEVKCALAEMARGKAPGRDGLPKELWELQWDLLDGQVMQFVKEFERTGSLPKEFSTAVTVLLHKKGAKDDLQNYRPITLLSTAYKWVEGLYHEAATHICNDGWLREEVLVQTGVRQGCPLAPYLFLCAVEPFCQEARRRWLGIDVKGAGKLTYLGNTDDTTLLLKDRSQLDDAEMLLKDFERQSGLAVNRDKSVVLPLGRQRDLPPPTAGSFKWASRDDPNGVSGASVPPSGCGVGGAEEAIVGG
ncbi:unnamed protein product [Closterium sp. NIES-53]